jgi:hypothetical protein
VFRLVLYTVTRRVHPTQDKGTPDKVLLSTSGWNDPILKQHFDAVTLGSIASSTSVELDDLSKRQTA